MKVARAIGNLLSQGRVRSAALLNMYANAYCVIFIQISVVAMYNIDREIRWDGIGFYFFVGKMRVLCEFFELFSLVLCFMV